MLGRAALRGKRRIDIAVRDMTVARAIEPQRLNPAPRVADDSGPCRSIDRRHLRARAVHAPRTAIVAREADGVAGLEFQRPGFEDLNMAGTPLPQPPIDFASV